jgi:hypothetical protein
MDGSGNNHVKQNKPHSERQILRFHSYAESRPEKDGMIIKRGPFWGNEPGGGRDKGKKKRALGVHMIEVHYRYTHIYENSIMKPIKTF